jgi:hypothetical protein
VKHRLLLLIPLWLAAATGDYEAVRKKIDLIEADRLAPGHRVELTAAELNAYVAREVAEAVPDGVRDPRVQLGDRTATATALIDFGKLRRAQGSQPGWLLGKLLDGERPVRVTAAIRSSGGTATVDVQSVEVAGMVIEGRALDFLIDNFLIPRYPDAAIGRPFELGHRIDRLEVQPSAVGVVIGK